MPTKFEPLTLALPTHWVPAIVNADLTGLDDAEADALDRWETDIIQHIGAFHIGEVSDEEYFARYHDAAEYGVLACMCYDVTLMVRVPPAAPVSSYAALVAKAVEVLE